MDEVMKELVTFAGDTKFSDLPAEVVSETKRLLLDSIGCGIGGKVMQRGKIATELATRLGGLPEATILGTSTKVSCGSAAFANGELINALDWDACLGVHLPPFVIPAPLAVAENVSASGKDLILSVTLGHEIARRIQMATAPAFYPIKRGAERGKMRFEPVSGHGSGVFGAAAGVGKILSFSPEKMANAMGIAGYAGPPSTLRKWTDTAPCSMTKFGPCGFAAEVGIRSAMLADMGYHGDTTIFKGECGYWRFSGFQEWDKKAVTKGLGSKWNCAQVSYKQYPCGH